KYADDPAHKALIWTDGRETRELTYRELMARANRCANVLVSHGLGKGDVVIVMMPRLIEAYVAYVAALKAGIVVIPSSEMLRATDIDYRLVHSDAKAIIAYAPFADQFKQARHMDGVELFIVGESEQGIQLLD